jgi:hypothetical protein
MADGIINQGINKFSSGLNKEFLDMTYPDEYYKNTIQPAKAGTGQMPSKMQMASKAQPFKAMMIGMDPYLPGFMQQGYDKFRAAPTSAANNFLKGVGNVAKFGMNRVAPLAGIFASTPANADETNMTIEDFQNLQNNTFTSSVANSPYEMDYMPPDRYRNFEQRVGTPQTTEEEKLSLFQRGKDLASSGIGKAGKLGMDAFNMLKNNNPIGLLTSGLASLGDMFEDKTLYGDTIDEYGNRYTADQLNSMNARGGGYTDAARSSRRRTARISKMQQRRDDGYNFSLKNLQKLQMQEALQKAANEQREATLAAQAAAGTHTRGGTAIDFGDYYNSDGSANTSSSMANNPSQSYGGPRAKGGFIGYKNGGLVKMFKGKL